MRYAFNSGIFGCIHGWVNSYHLDEAMRRIAAIGYDGIEVLCAAPHAWPDYLSDEDKQGIIALKKELKLEIHSLMPLRDGYAGHNLATDFREEREWSLGYIKKVIDLAEIWGANNISYCPGWQSPTATKREAWKYALQSLMEVGRYAAAKGISVCINPPVPLSEVVDTPQDALLLMEESGLANVKVMFDMESCFNYMLDPADIVYLCGKKLGHILLCDRGRAAIGKGGYDFYPLLRALKDIDYAGYATVDTGRGRAAMPTSIARLSFLHLRDVENALK